VIRQAAFGLCLLVAADGAAAQAPARRRPAAESPAATTQPAANTQVRDSGIEDHNARETRERLSELLRQYPPSLGHVLRLDPSLMTSETYLAPYPALAAFLAQHPEVAHNPSYFVGELGFVTIERSPKLRLIEETLAGLAMFIAFLSIAGIVGWLLKSLIDYRRWLRQSKVQTDVHTKLLDRFTSNEELLAYIQTPVGRRFLESAPIALDAAPRAIAAPVGRILWSVQAGLVVGLAGFGLLFATSRLSAVGADGADIAAAVYGIAVLAIAIGLGFVLSAIVAYGLSRRLGLFEPPPVAPHA